MCYIRTNRRILKKKKKKYLARKNSSIAALDVNLKMRKLKCLKCLGPIDYGNLV